MTSIFCIVIWRSIFVAAYLFHLLGSTKSNGKGQLDTTSSIQETPSAGLNKALIVAKADTSVPSSLKSFSFSDLKNATKNFRSESLLGEGGFGWVFKGWIDANTFAPTKPGTGLVVAIKRLKRESFQGHKEWLVCRIWTVLLSILTLLFWIWICNTFQFFRQKLTILVSFTMKILWNS